MTGLEWHGEFDPDSKSSRSIRDDRYAYVVRYANGDAQGKMLGKMLGNRARMAPSQIEFYDLQNDPWQLNDLVDDQTVSAEKDRLAARLREVGLKTGDPRITGEDGLIPQDAPVRSEAKENGLWQDAGIAIRVGPVIGNETNAIGRWEPALLCILVALEEPFKEVHL